MRKKLKMNKGWHGRPIGFIYEVRPADELSANAIKASKLPVISEQLAGDLIASGMAEYVDSPAKTKRKRKSTDSGTSDTVGSKTTPVDKPVD